MVFSRLVMAGLIGLLAVPSSACTGSFDLSFDEGDEFILTPPDQDTGGVHVYLDGAKDLDLEEVIALSCRHGNYAIPVVKAHVETGVSSATRREYFVYEKKNADYTPLKSILSVDAVDRETGEVISKPLIAVENDIRLEQLCDSIPGDSGADQPVWPVEQ
ncbi:hypothetical protein SAMN05216203_1282 [Marinobacter daqiaonensis]|uniref:Lipoprotein n=1 Tax=Marinobacter daqiaonensis TaxID=650891 RepID=A0A1I6HJ30_9GAMM|nr:hypothetical protein [Marinobacter daqiaonensis]SFR54418.1 hypothetical protein SAMN05216203_1282 [Marinobacter daqiaonensis]